jgi:hypothetical protein
MRRFREAAYIRGTFTNTAQGANNPADMQQMEKVAAIGALKDPTLLAAYKPCQPGVVRQQQALGALLCGAEPNARLERSLAVMAGLIVADGAGAPFEFRQFRGPGGVYTPDHGIKGAFGLPEMAGTDDSSMAMAFLHSLYRNGHTLNFLDQKIRYWLWWTAGYCNASGYYPATGPLLEAHHSVLRPWRQHPGGPGPRRRSFTASRAIPAARPLSRMPWTARCTFMRLWKAFCSPAAADMFLSAIVCPPR